MDWTRRKKEIVRGVVLAVISLHEKEFGWRGGEHNQPISSVVKRWCAQPAG